MKKLLLILALLTTPAQANDRLTIVLDWFVNPDHGPIIVAQQRGYFEEAGLDVEIIAPADPADPPKMVAAGRADLGVSYQPQLYLQHEAGLPVVRVASLVNAPLYCVMVNKSGDVKSLGDLRGRKIGFSVAGIEEALLHTMLRHNGVEPSETEQINVNFALTSALASGQVDAVSGAFRNFELHQMRYVGREGQCFNPEDHGVPAYDELIYLARADHDPEPLQRFFAATRRAAHEIAADPQAGFEDFRAYSAELKDQLNHDAWFDTVPFFAQDPLELDHARYEAFGTYMVGTGLITKAPPMTEITRELDGAAK